MGIKIWQFDCWFFKWPKLMFQVFNLGMQPHFSYLLFMAFQFFLKMFNLVQRFSTPWDFQLPNENSFGVLKLASLHVSNLWKCVWITWQFNFSPNSFPFSWPNLGHKPNVKVTTIISSKMIFTSIINMNI